MPPFSISESLGFGWRTFREHSGIMLGAVLILIVVELAARLFGGTQTPSAGATGALVAGTCLDVILSIGFIIITLKLARGESAHLRDLIPPGRLFWQSIVTSIGLGILIFLVVVIGVLFGLGIGMLAGGSKILMSILIALGACAGAVAGLYLAVRYAFLRFVAIDGVRPMGEIFHRSAALSLGLRWRLLWFVIVLGCIDVAGAIIVIGLLVAVPVTSLALADVYLKLGARDKAPAPASN